MHKFTWVISQAIFLKYKDSVIYSERNGKLLNGLRFLSVP